MPAKQLKEFLDRNKIRYISLVHSPAYTAQEVAATAHVPGRELAKTIILKQDGRMVMAVLPANRKILLPVFRRLTGAHEVHFATETEFKSLFPDCDTGAMPPFGNLYGLEVYVALGLTADEQIAFNAGTHSEVIKMAYTDFARLVQPKLMDFSD